MPKPAVAVSAPSIGIAVGGILVLWRKLAHSISIGRVGDSPGFCEPPPPPPPSSATELLDHSPIALHRILCMLLTVFHWCLGKGFHCTVGSVQDSIRSSRSHGTSMTCPLLHPVSLPASMVQLLLSTRRKVASAQQHPAPARFWHKLVQQPDGAFGHGHQRHRFCHQVRG